MRRPWLRPIVAAIFVFALCPAATAQAPEKYEEEKKRAFAFYDQHNHVSAMPILEWLASQEPDDVQVAERLCFSVLLNAVTIPDPEQRRKERVRARQVALRAKELGSKSALVDIVLMVPEDGSEGKYSENEAVEQAMQEGEAAFARGEMEKAIEGYSKALALNPKQYEAALYIGDVYFKQKRYEEAGPWFARAIEIDPGRETAYRYWGDALLQWGKEDEAGQKFIEAIVAEPYNKMSFYGIRNWAQRKRVQLSHPRIQSPNRLTKEGDKTTITIDAGSLEKSDGTSAWLLYEITRSAWSASLFAKKFPDEKEYRHSLAEEAEALGNVVGSVREKIKAGEVKELDPSLKALIKLEEAGLLEAYILFARADAGIAQDYPAYREKNRDRLIRYWNEIVLANASEQPPQP